ncbi:hypothetical protein [Parendozoicomonas haliclonae]|uniref:DUF2059 domain-containing protein n=1 Tax=Parendozoicomonas haliclonae TaxID=1960125 RepID=A0A1X7AK33_9GAMM|nr:hypothetical protein [Parendozoicomonas haliclonae]SMA46382.1 hypothetical protein EHSB41UT_02158 [Parendozoicomonas haliclonae]
MVRSLLAVILFAAIATPGYAASREQAASLYGLAGLHKNYSGWKGSMGNILNNYQRVLPPEVFQQVNDRYRVLAAESRYQRRTILALRRKLSDQEAKVLLNWYQNKGKTFAANERSLDAESLGGKSLSSWYRQQILTDERRALLQALIKETQAVEQSAQFITSSALSMATLVAQYMPDGQSLDIGKVEAGLTQQMPAIVKELQTVSLARFVWIYQDIPNERLREYIAFVKTPEARRWFSVVNDIQSEMIQLQGS